MEFLKPLTGQDDVQKQLQKLQQDLHRLEQEHREKTRKLQEEVENLKKQLDDQKKVQAEKKEEPKSPDQFVKVALGTMSLGATIRVWYVATENDPDSSANEANEPDGFRIRHAQIRLSGEVIPEAGYTLMIDPARAIGSNETAGQTRRILQDAIIHLHLNKILDLKHPFRLDVGQFKIPVSLEGMTPDARLDFPDRAIVSRTFGDKRDIGAMLTGKYFDEAVEYQLGIFNAAGHGQNRTRDENDQKHAAGRLAVRPFKAFANDLDFLRELHLGVSRIEGQQGEIGASGNQYRMGAEVSWSWKDFMAKSEYLRGHDTVGDDEDTVRADGWYVTVGYSLKGLAPETKVLKDIQILARYEEYDPNRDASRNKTDGVTLGMNYFIKGHNVKIQSSYTWYDEEGTDIDNNEFILVFQVFF